MSYEQVAEDVPLLSKHESSPLLSKHESSPTPLSPSAYNAVNSSIVQMFGFPHFWPPSFYNVKEKEFVKVYVREICSKIGSVMIWVGGYDLCTSIWDRNDQNHVPILSDDDDYTNRNYEQGPALGKHIYLALIL